MKGLEPTLLSSSKDIIDTSTPDVPNVVVEEVLSFVTSSAYTLLPPVLAFFSGQLWIFIISLYTKIPAKALKFLNKWYGRVALGLAWEALVLIPIYFIAFRNLHIQAANIAEIEFTVLVISLALQLPIVGLIILLYKGVQKHEKHN